MAVTVKMRVLQIGTENWAKKYNIPEKLDWHYAEPNKLELALRESDGSKARAFDVTLLTAPCLPSALSKVESLVVPHTVLVDERLKDRKELAGFFDKMRPSFFKQENLQVFIEHLYRQYYEIMDGGGGGSFHTEDIVVMPNFRNSVTYEGNYFVVLDEEYSDDFQQVMCWRQSFWHGSDKASEFWIEYEKDSSCEIQVYLRVYAQGGAEEPYYTKIYSENELKGEPLVFEHYADSYLCVSIFAKGRGKLKVGNLHVRKSRLGAGQLIAGGERVVYRNKQELFYYFSPGNMKPPLNVYFSGWKTLESFEGLWMMRGLKHPFILISEARLEGGAFYFGNKEYEKGLVKVIQDCLDELHFSTDELILSGFSMGTTGSLYYGALLKPHAILIGKPLVNLGTIASNTLFGRPDEFLTSLDILRYHTGDLSDQSIKRLNNRMKDRLREADFSKTKLAIGYMLQDDYDDQGYYDIMATQEGKQTEILGRGFLGRHNDDTTSVVVWIVDQYRRIIREDFEEKH